MLIGLAVSESGAYMEGVLRGVAAYAQAKRDWIFELQPPTEQGVSALLAAGSVGLILNGLPLDLEGVISKVKVPCVNVGPRLGNSRVSHVTNDNHAIGAMAAEHLLLRGFRAFGYCTRTGGELDTRLDGFQAFLAQRGIECSVFDVKEAIAHPVNAPLPAVPTWLKRQAKPLALFCMADRQARELTQECVALGLNVPGDVAILGVDNNIGCILVRPQLSSVQTSAQRIGYEAARHLDELVSIGGPPREVHVPPARVVTRASTDVTVGVDEVVRSILDHMRQHLTDAEGIDRLCTRFGVSRRQLERRFVAATSSTPAQVWAGFRLEAAKQLLADTSHTMEQVAQRSGYGDGKRFSVSFKKATGMTPGRFRELLTH